MLWVVRALLPDLQEAPMPRVLSDLPDLLLLHLANQQPRQVGKTQVTKAVPPVWHISCTKCQSFHLERTSNYLPHPSSLQVLLAVPPPVSWARVQLPTAPLRHQRAGVQTSRMTRVQEQRQQLPHRQRVAPNQEHLAPQLWLHQLPESRPWATVHYPQGKKRLALFCTVTTVEGQIRLQLYKYVCCDCIL